MSPRYKYYCRVNKPSEETLPAAGLKRFVPYTKRMYEACVDEMVCGYAIYDRVLEPWEVFRWGLISMPVE